MEFSLGRLTCTACRKVIRPTYTTCIAGHYVCPHCTKHNTVSAEVDQLQCDAAELQLTFLDTIFENMLDSCQYKCGYRGRILHLKSHESACGNMIREKSAKCVIDQCSWNDSVRKLLDHVHNEHPKCLILLPETAEDGFFIEFESPVALISLFNIDSYFNELYLLNMYQNGEDRHILIQNIAHTVLENDAEQTLDEFTITSKENMRHLLIGNIYKADMVSYEENLKNDEFVLKNGTEISALEGNKYLVQMKNSKLLEISKDLISEVECDICTEIMWGKIQLCNSGHSMCEKCAEKLEHCAKCLESITKSRNYVLERLLEKYSVVCEFRKSGCPVINSNKIMSKHVKLCEFRPIACWRTNCTWTGLVRDLSQHSTTVHKGIVKDINTTYTMLVLDDRSKWYTVCFPYNNNFFFLIMTFDDDFQFSVSHLNYGESEFHFDIVFSNPTMGHSMQFQLSCNNATMDNIRDKTFTSDGNNPCKIPRTLFFDQICNEMKKLKFAVNIYKNDK